MRENSRNFSKGFFLVFTLLLVSLITVSCLVMVSLTQTNQVSSNANVINTKLMQLANQNIQAVAATLNTATDGIMRYLDNQKAQIYFVTVDKTGVAKPNIQCKIKSDSTKPYNCSNPLDDNKANIADLNAYIFTDNNNIKLSTSIDTLIGNSITAPEGFAFSKDNSRITQKKYNTNNNQATYTVNISQRVCTGDGRVCQDQSSDFEFTRVCPNSLNGKSMRPLTDVEIKLIASSPAGGGYDNSISYPNLYCTCSDDGYPLTNSLGTCCGTGCLFNGTDCYAPNGSFGVPGSLGKYKDSDEKCKDCSEGCNYCLGPNNCLSCFQVDASSGYYLDRQNKSCLRCGYGMKNIIGQPYTGYYDTSVRPIPTCSPCNNVCLYCTGPNNGQCISCKAGYIKGLITPKTCFECPDGTFSFDDFRSPLCAINDKTDCAVKSKTANRCLECVSRKSNSSMLEQDGYYLYEPDGGCYKCPLGKLGLLGESMERCQCPNGVDVSKDGVLFNGYRWLQRRHYDDRSYWEDNCKG